MKSIINKTFLFSLLLTLSAGQSSTAQSLDEVVNLVLQGNSAIELFQAQGNADYLLSKTENNLGDTEIEVSHEWGNNGAGNKFIVSASQGFDWPGLYSARSKATAALAAKSAAELDALKASTALEARLLIIDIVYRRKLNNLLTRVAEGYGKILTGALFKYEHREITLLDLNKIKIEAANSELAAMEGVDQLSELLSQLDLLAGNQSVSLDMIPEDIPAVELADLDSYLSLIGENTPELRAAIVSIDYDRQLSSVVRRERAPGFSLGYVMEKELDATFHGFSIGLGLPIFSSRGKVAAANARAITSTLAAEQVRLDLQRQIILEHKLAMSLRRQLNAFGPAISLVDNLALIQRAFDLGQCDLDHYFLDTNYFLEAQEKYIDIERQYLRALYTLNRLVP